MENIAIYSKKLEWLDVPYTNVTEKGIQMVCEQIPKLCHLGLTRTDKVSLKQVVLLIYVCILCFSYIRLDKAADFGFWSKLN